MNTTTKTKEMLSSIALLFILTNGLVAASMGTAFTYQGVATDNGRPATGLYDVQCALYDAPTNGIPIGPTLNFPGSTTDNNGVFTVPLDFGSTAFNGQARWLQFSVRTNGSTGPFATLTPLQQLTPVPAAIYATQAETLFGTVPTTQITGNFPTERLVGVLPSDWLSGTYSRDVTFSNAANYFSGNGAGLNSVNAATLGGLGGETFWHLGGNAGATAGVKFLGTTDNQPLEFKVNNIRGLRIEPNASNQPNVVGGAPDNAVANGIVCAMIGGGSANTVNAAGGTIAGGFQNNIRSGANYATIGGGYLNTLNPNAYAATIAGGVLITISTNAQYGVICGGYNNSVQNGANYGVIGGGYGNQVLGHYGTILGGYLNRATDYSFAAGYRSKANHAGTFVWSDNTSADFASTGAKQFLIRASGGVGIGLNNPTAALDVMSSGTALKATTAGSYAVIGSATNKNVRNFGGSFSAFGPDGIGVDAYAKTGVNGVSGDANGVGVIGYANNVSNDAVTYGGIFRSDGISCTGVYGRASGLGGFGVIGYGGQSGFDFDAQGPGLNYGATSSIRWKKDITLIGEPLDKLMALRGVYFNWDTEHGGSHDVGMIAEEVGEVLPEIVGYEANGIDARSMDYSKLTPLLVEAGKALKTEVDALRQQMAEKDSRISALESDLAELKTSLSILLDPKQGAVK